MHTRRLLAALGGTMAGMMTLVDATPSTTNVASLPWEGPEVIETFAGTVSDSHGRFFLHTVAGF